jgi:hypothetical protein
MPDTLLDPSNKTEDRSASDDQAEIPAILVNAAGLDGQLEELRKSHKTGLLDNDAIVLSQTWTEPQES